MATVHIPKPSRESVTTIAEDGSRNFLRPADVSGRFTFWRRLTAVGLIAVYVLLPWIHINGYPAVFLDVVRGRFHLFGITLATQDVWLAFFLITGLGFGLFFVTALFGRLWCGWACPQTVFLEHVFRRVERLFEGDAYAQKRLDKAPWDTNKILRRGGKHFVFLFLAAVVAHIFLSYFVSLPELYTWMTTSPLEHWKAFVFVTVTTALLYFNFSWFREQLCIIICPYGRFQSALIDDDSLVIGYDEKRGEPRGKATDPTHGDCIDCNRCVQVCPTGIDIRQGLQMECIGCANCIDACNDIMAKIDRPLGLIRYDSQTGLEGKKRKFLRPRIILYSVLLLLGATVLGFSLTRVSPGNLSLVRMVGAPYYVTDELVRNQYTVRLINKRNQPVTYTLKTEFPADVRSHGFDEPIIVPAMGEIVRTFVIALPRANYTGPFAFELIFEGVPGGFILKRPGEFLGPDPQTLKRTQTSPAL